MLAELAIDNFTILEHQQISFEPGFTVLTGETGSGKSIIVKALNFVLGKRSDKTLIGGFGEFARVQAVFRLSEKNFPKIKLSLPDLITEPEIIISRTLHKSGRNQIYINGQISNLTTLQMTKELLINISSQGEFSELLQADNHRTLLDFYADKPELVSEVKAHFQDLKSTQIKINTLEQQMAEARDKQDYLNFNISQLEAVELVPGKRESLQAQLMQQKNLSVNAGLLSEVVDLFDQEQGIFSLQSILARSASDLGKKQILSESDLAGLEEVDSILNDFYQNVSDRQQKLEEQIESQDSEDFVPATKLEDQLAQIAALQRKFSRDEQGLVELLADYKEQQRLALDEQPLIELRKQAANLEQNLSDAAIRLTAVRRQSSDELTKIINKNLAGVALGHAKFAISVTDKNLNADGSDQVQFLLAANPGQKLAPLDKVASGGEISRIFLAIKKAFIKKAFFAALFFDEIDTGISGEVAAKVAATIAEIAKDQQVICITHLPQVAAAASHHQLIAKDVSSAKSTTVTIVPINEKERAAEIAKMFSGESDNKAALKVAEKMLKH